MSYIIELKGRGKYNLSFHKSKIVLEAGENKINIEFDEINKIKLNPARKTSHYYFPPQCILFTNIGKFKFTSRATVHKSVTTIFVSKENDVNIMSNLVHELHKILVKKGLENKIQFILGGYLHFSSIFIYPPLVIAPVVVGTDGSILFSSISIIIYLLVIIAAKTEKYSPTLLAENIRSVSKRLS